MSPIVHPPEPIISVLRRVLDAVYSDRGIDEAMARYAPGEPDLDNCRIRWLSRRRGYEVVLYMDADTLVTNPAPPPASSAA